MEDLIKKTIEIRSRYAKEINDLHSLIEKKKEQFAKEIEFLFIRAEEIVQIIHDCFGVKKESDLDRNYFNNEALSIFDDDDDCIGDGHDLIDRLLFFGSQKKVYYKLKISSEWPKEFKRYSNYFPTIFFSMEDSEIKEYLKKEFEKKKDSYLNSKQKKEEKIKLKKEALNKLTKEEKKALGIPLSYER